MSEYTVAESAFISAVVATLEAQRNVVQANDILRAAMQRAETANEALQREQHPEGIDSDLLDPQALINEQEKYFDEAILRSGMGEDDRVVRAVRQSIMDARTLVALFQEEESKQLGKIQGPQL